MTFTLNFLTQTARGNLDENKLVADLIDERSKQWKDELLAEMFFPDETSAIKTLNVSKIGLPYKLIWHYEKRGFYIVKSG